MTPDTFLATIAAIEVIFAVTVWIALRGAEWSDDIRDDPDPWR